MLQENNKLVDFNKIYDKRVREINALALIERAV